MLGNMVGNVVGNLAGNAAGNAQSAMSGLVSGIHQTGSKINTASKNVKVNKKQSIALSARIDRLIGFLNVKQLENLSGGPIRKALESFLTFLKECLAFIEKFGKTGWFSRIRNHSNHADKFHELNQELNQYANDLSVGLQINILGRLIPENKADAEDDLREINEIVQRTLVPPPPPSIPPRANATGRANPTGPPATGKVRPAGLLADPPKNDSKHRPSSRLHRYDLSQPQYRSHHHHHHHHRHHSIATFY
ncbi:unnamed protein product [Adineta steineri]|uniref:Mixed lineage kinase domain-containing protein n=1 Tax=Adineta steineri TaxID=433720 RepID=A0A818M871_9BILA|nr:unnamed protein product [Adineta steineri]CAF3582137.1 unnamed protein product [Adineta steineri]